jgi:glutaredoxin
MIKIYGAKWCGDVYRILFYFDKKELPFQYFDIDEDKSAEEFVIKINPEGNRSIPVVVLEDESILIEPTISELEEKLDR